MFSIDPLLFFFHEFAVLPEKRREPIFQKGRKGRYIVYSLFPAHHVVIVKFLMVSIDMFFFVEINLRSCDF